VDDKNAWLPQWRVNYRFPDVANRSNHPYNPRPRALALQQNAFLKREQCIVFKMFK